MWHVKTALIWHLQSCIQMSNFNNTSHLSVVKVLRYVTMTTNQQRSNITSVIPLQCSKVINIQNNRPAFQRMLRCSWLQLNCFAKPCDSSRQLSSCRSWSDERYWYMPWSSCWDNFTTDTVAVTTSICSKALNCYKKSRITITQTAHTQPVQINSVMLSFWFTRLAILTRSPQTHGGWMHACVMNVT